MSNAIVLSDKASLPWKFMTRHLAVTGATGSGKTQTLFRLVEEALKESVPVIALDPKGDFSTLRNETGARSLYTSSRYHRGARQLLGFALWRMEPYALARALKLNATQSQLLAAMMKHKSLGEVRPRNPQDFARFLSARSKDAEIELLNLTDASLGVIMRALTASQLGDYASECITTQHWITSEGFSGLNIVEVRDMAASAPDVYGAFVAQLLCDLCGMPEIGETEKPKVMVIIDEAHMLFDGAGKESLALVSRNVRLLRSKGVALVFASQAAMDFPAEVYTQFGSRVMHCDPMDARLGDLGVGEAMVRSFRDEGRPFMTGAAKINRHGMRTYPAEGTLTNWAAPEHPLDPMWPDGPSAGGASARPAPVSAPSGPIFSCYRPSSAPPFTPASTKPHHKVADAIVDNLQWLILGMAVVLGWMLFGAWYDSLFPTIPAWGPNKAAAAYWIGHSLGAMIGLATGVIALLLLKRK